MNSSSWPINRATSMPLHPSPALVSTREGIDDLFCCTSASLSAYLVLTAVYAWSSKDGKTEKILSG